jgi:hypothetical protein
MAKKEEKSKEIIKEHKEKKEELKQDTPDLSSSTADSKKTDKQAVILLAIFGAIILLVIGGLVYQNSLNHVDFEGMRFTKTQSGQVTFYTTPNIFLIRTNGDVLGSTSVDFRTSPIELAKIPIDVSTIQFKEDRQTYISFDDVKICEDNGIASATFGFFLSNFGIKRVAALTNESKAIENNLTYVTCENSQDNTVILIKNGDETTIKQLSANCYIIQSKDCDILKATERFQLAFLQDYVNEINKAKVVLPAEYFK